MSAHVADHYFQGICICPCRECTVHLTPENVRRGVRPDEVSIRCTCQGCDVTKCGAR